MSIETELKLSRIFTIVLGFGAFLVAFYIRQAYNALMFAWTFYAASVGIPAFAALFWKKATTAGMYAGILAGFFVSVGWKMAGTPMNLGPAIPGSICCALALIVVSLITFKPDKPANFPICSSFKLFG